MGFLKPGVLCFALLLTVRVEGFARPPRGVSRSIEKLIDSSPGVKRGRFGYKVIDLESGDVLAEQNAQHFFTPASNTKLYTTALALVRLGPNYKWHTELRTSGNWVARQPTIHDLELIGGGDPNVSGRHVPYDPKSKDGDPLTVVEQFADTLANSGIREVDGDVTGVATRYSGDVYPDGWTIDDALYSYGAPVSSLAVNDNAISVNLRPTKAGELAEVELRPRLEHFIVLNQVVTDNSNTTNIHAVRPAGSNELVLWGSIGEKASPWSQDCGVNDPALFAAEAMIHVLRQHGIAVRGTARAEYRNLSVAEGMGQQGQPLHSAGTVLAVHESASLGQEIQIINKASQNLHAEMLLREVARVVRGVGTLAAGLDERKKFLEEIGIVEDGTGFAFGDGSGLARQNLTTPESTVQLLRYMWQRPDRDVWLQSLPIGGVDGTLDDRFQKIRGAERVHAKTGEIEHVNALSGYLESRPNHWLAFSIMVNATTAKDAAVHDFLDQFCAIFLDR